MVLIPRTIGIATCGLRGAATLLALCLSGLSAAEGHEAIEKQIAGLDQRIAKTPDDAVLFLRRGELHRIHLDWDQAEADYRTARRLDPGLPAVDLCLGRMFFEHGRPLEAKEALDRYLAQRPGDAEGLRYRGRTLARLGLGKEAAEDYQRLCTSAPSGRPDPDAYLELATILSADGGREGREAALRTLDQGMSVLGSIVSLALPAIEIETDLGRFDAALKRLDAVTPASGRREIWTLRRAGILQRAGRAPEAEAAYRKVLRQIAALPEDRRASHALEEIEAQARSRLAEVSRALGDGHR